MLSGALADFLEPAEFSDLLEDLGEIPAFWHRRVGPCPRCVDPVGGFDRRDPACPNCNGSGEIYRVMALPLTGRTCGRVVATNAMIGKTRSPIELQGGEVTLLYNPDDYPLSDGDRLGFSSRLVGDQDLVRRDETRTGSLIDRLRYRPVSAILNVYDRDEELLTGFRVATDKTGIKWAASGGPAVGADYVVCYQFLLTYRVQRAGIHHRVRAADGSAFPNRVILTLDQLAPTDVTAGQGL